MTQKKRVHLEEEIRQTSLRQQERSRKDAQKAGIVLTMTIPAGTGRVVVEGRIAKVVYVSVLLRRIILGGWCYVYVCTVACVCVYVCIYKYVSLC